jgi:CBS domain containing-hemolysin-like protein
VTTLLIAAFLTAVAASALFSGSETGIYALNKLRLELKAGRGSRVARSIRRLLAEPGALLCLFLAGNNLVNDAATVIAQELLLRATQSEHIEALTTLVVTPIIFFFGEVIPKSAFHANAERFVPRVWPILEVVRVLLYPLVALLRPVAALASHIARVGLEEGVAGTRGREALALLLGEVHERGLLSPNQQAIAANVATLATRRVAVAMVPMARVETLPAAMPAGEALLKVKNSVHVFFPVVAGAKGSEVLGYVSFLDLLYQEKPESTVADHVRPLEVLPADLHIEDALVRMARHEVRMGLVTQGGRPLGIVTHKDLVEEIVGELRGF